MNSRMTEVEEKTKMSRQKLLEALDFIYKKGSERNIKLVERFACNDCSGKGCDNCEVTGFLYSDDPVTVDMLTLWKEFNFDNVVGWWEKSKRIAIGD